MTDAFTDVTLNDPPETPLPEHRCDWGSPWPTGHPLPVENPDKLTGPEVGAFVMYHPKGRSQATVVRVLHRSYVWSPGECRSKGGNRRYDWSVIEEGPGKYRSVVVDDEDLSPIPSDARVIYGLRGIA